MVQSLDDDSVMVFSSNPGRISEVTRKGEVVWDFYAGENYQNPVVPIRGQRLESSCSRQHASGWVLTNPSDGC